MTFKLPAVSMLLLAALFAVTGPRPLESSGQTTDLDAFMETVLTRRDGSWQKLQQYVLEEREAFDLNGPGGARVFGFRRDYSWFIREGYFVRSPVCGFRKFWPVDSGNSGRWS